MFNSPLWYSNFISEQRKRSIRSTFPRWSWNHIVLRDENIDLKACDVSNWVANLKYYKMLSMSEHVSRSQYNEHFVLKPKQKIVPKILRSKRELLQDS